MNNISDTSASTSSLSQSDAEFMSNFSALESSASTNVENVNSQVNEIIEVTNLSQEEGSTNQESSATGSNVSGGNAEGIEESKSDSQDEEDNSKTIDWSILSKPFKANGVEVTFKTPEELISAAQQGLNYTKKMVELKPAKLLHDTLKAHGLDNPEKLNMLIAASKGDKGAISKLIRDHNIETFDLGEDTEYTPQEYRPDDSQVEAQTLIEEISSMPNGSDVLNDIKTKPEWESSIQYFAKQPQALKDLVNLRNLPEYATVMGEAYKRMAINESYRNMPLIINVATVFQEMGIKLDGSNKQQNSGSNVSEDKSSFKGTAPKKSNDAELNDKRKKVASSTSSPVDNYLDPNDAGKLNDEEFMKLFKQLS